MQLRLTRYVDLDEIEDKNTLISSILSDIPK
jgi:hypothetical protein